MKSRRKNFGNLPRGIDPQRQRRAEDAQFTDEILGNGLKRDGKGRIVLDPTYIRSLIETPEPVEPDEDIGLTGLEDVQLSETADGHILAYEGGAGTWTNRAQTASPGADHGFLTGLTDDDHGQYSRTDGTRTFTGDINIGTNDITGVGLVDGRDVSADGTGMDSLRSTGILTGGDLSINGDNVSIDITAGTGQIFDPSSQTLTPVSWSTTNLPITGIATTELTNISVDSGGLFVQTTNTEVFFDDYLTHIQLGRAGHRDHLVIASISSRVCPAFDMGSMLRDLFLSNTPKSTGGNVYSAAASDLTLFKSVGTGMGMGRGYILDKDKTVRVPDPELNPVTFTRIYYNGTGTGIGITLEEGETDVNPGQYDDNSGTLQTVPSGKWTTQKIFFGIGSETTGIYYGTKLYKNLSDAMAGAFLEEIPASTITSQLVQRAFLFVKGNATDLSNVAQGVFREVSGPAAGSGSGVGGTTLQSAYDASGEPEIELNSTEGALSIHDAATPIGANLLEVMDNAGVTEFFAVDVSGASVDGTLAATGAVTGSNLSGTNTGDEPNASQSVIGVSRLATIAEVDAQMDLSSTITPGTLAASALQTAVDGLGALAPLDTVSATEIDNAAVTLAKMANLAQGAMIGRGIAAGTGVPTALTGNAIMANMFAAIAAHTLIGTSTTTGSATQRTAGTNSILARAVGDMVWAPMSAGEILYRLLGGGDLAPTLLSAAVTDSKVGKCFTLMVAENGSMSTTAGTGGTGYQYSAGNGENGPTMGIVAPYDYELYSISLTTHASNTSTIAVRANASTTLNSLTASGAANQATGLSNSGSAGDVLNFQTTATGGTVTGAHVLTAFFVEV